MKRVNQLFKCLFFFENIWGKHPKLKVIDWGLEANNGRCLKVESKALRYMRNRMRSRSKYEEKSAEYLIYATKQ